MADIELVEAVANYEYVITVYDPQSVDAYDNPVIISFAALGITQAFLYIVTQDFVTKLVNGDELFFINDYQLEWPVSPSDVPIGSAGEYFGQIDFQDSHGNSIYPNYPYLSVRISKKLKGS